MNKLIKRTLLFFIALLIAITLFTACEGNRQVFDTTWSFDRAIVSLPDGSVISGKVDSWTDFDDGDQIQVKIDGVTYLVHSSNVALIDE